MINQPEQTKAEAKLDLALFRVNARALEQFQALVDSPSPPSEALRQLLSTPAPWEQAGNRPRGFLSRDVEMGSPGVAASTPLRSTIHRGRTPQCSPLLPERSPLQSFHFAREESCDIVAISE